jgi:diacylglycerol kinase (ATP)
LKKDILLIVNPASAGGRTGRGWTRIAAQLRQAGLDFDSVLTRQPGQATELTRRAALAGQPVIAAVGGDGTINEVVNGFFEHGQPIATQSRLGIVPLGTGGDFRRSFQIPLDLAASARILTEGRTRRIDAGRVSYIRPDGKPGLRHFINVADAGIGGEVVHCVNHGPRLPSGPLTFATASLISLMRWRNKLMRVVADGDVYNVMAQQVVIANGQYYGGGMRVAPRAAPDDGKLDLLMAGDMGRLESIRLMGPIRRGTHLGAGKITYRTVRRVEVGSPDPVRVDTDGEQPGMLPATFEVIPGAIDLVVPWTHET